MIVLGFVIFAVIIVLATRSNLKRRRRELAAIAAKEPKPTRNVIAPPGMMRVTDQERDAVAEELARHFQVGRLGRAEFDRRISYALEARTRDELDKLLMDLPVSG